MKMFEYYKQMLAKTITQRQQETQPEMHGVPVKAFYDSENKCRLGMTIKKLS
jgi:hypothetical protein